MKTYLLQSDKFKGDVIFEFNDDGFLVKYDVTNAMLNEEQTIFILHKLPKSVDGIQKVLGSSKGAKLVLQKVVGVTFEMFWDKYNDKKRSCRKICERWWKKSKQIECDKAYNYIDTYEHNIPRGVAKKYAETYLNAELWNN